MTRFPSLPQPAEVPHIANDLQRYDINSAVSRLPRIRTLPQPNELAELHQVTVELPVVVEETITIKALVAHLQKARSNTAEFGLLFLPDGTQLVNAGTIERTSYGIGWCHFEPHSVADFHTHPDPTSRVEQRQPSLGDISMASRSHRPRRPYAIGSQDGLTVLNLPDLGRGEKLWQKYLHDRGITTRKAFDAYGEEKLYDEFVHQVIKPTFTTWAAMGSGQSLFNQIKKRGS